MSHSNLTTEHVITSVKPSAEFVSASLLTRILRVCYGLLCYAVAVLSLVYFILFINDLFIPITVNSGPFTTSLGTAVIQNFALLCLFGLQHSVMARPGFKQWLKQYMDPSIERATYCLATGLILGFICCIWVPMEGAVWTLQSTWAIVFSRVMAGLGWAILLLATFNIDHFELFGLRQVYSQFMGKPMPVMTFKMIGLYKWVRHPIQSGLLIGMWAVPVSTISHLMLAGGMTVYIFVGLYFEEKDLLRQFGNTYRNYKIKVGKVIPFM